MNPRDKSAVWRLDELEIVFGETPPEEDAGYVQVEDTYRILAARPGSGWPGSREDAFEVLTRASLSKPRERGEVIAEAFDQTMKTPRRLVAIVYDFDREPSTDGEIVRRTILAVLEQADALGVSTLGVPHDFGVSHGGIPEDEWLGILARVCRAKASRLCRLRKLVVHFPSDHRKRIAPSSMLFGILLGKTAL